MRAVGVDSCMSTFRAVALALLLAGCSSAETTGGPSEILTPISPGIPDPDAVVAIDLGVDSMTIFSPNFYMQRLGVQGVTRAGDRVNVSGVRWHSSNPAVVWVDSLEGSLIVPSTGRARLTVTWKGLTDSAELIAEILCRFAGPYSTGPARLRVGEQGQWTATVAACADVPGSYVRFSSTDTTVLAITPEGLGTARRAGSAVVIARLLPQGSSASALSVIVDP